MSHSVSQIVRYFVLDLTSLLTFHSPGMSPGEPCAETRSEFTGGPQPKRYLAILDQRQGFLGPALCNTLPDEVRALQDLGQL